VGTLCSLFSRSRQAYYKWHPSEFRYAAMESLVLDQTAKIRVDAPCMGAYKIYLILLDIFGRGNMMGRDAFYSLLKSNGLSLKKRTSRRTTHSCHHFHKWPNLVKGLCVDAPNRLWVSDITYLLLSDGGVCYLHLVTDAFSRKIVGWCVSSTLHASRSLEALDMAICEALKSGADLSRLIHHSDRGIQYCSHLYVTRLKSVGARISMTEDGNPTDNAIAERVNGILKQEYLCSQHMDGISEAYNAVWRAIGHYNGVRPHMSLGYKTPQLVHDHPEQIGPKAWKKRVYSTAAGT
jgi:transposase InsO family protein